jgi:hypothetical protein
MTGERRVVVHQGAKRAVKEVERFGDLERRFVERLAFVAEAIRPR